MFFTFKVTEMTFNCFGDEFIIWPNIDVNCFAGYCNQEAKAGISFAPSTSRVNGEALSLPAVQPNVLLQETSEIPHAAEAQPTPEPRHMTPAAQRSATKFCGPGR